MLFCKEGLHECGDLLLYLGLMDNERITELYQHYLIHPQVTTDTRKIEGGELFFALRGDRFDGNQYAAEALAKGAVLAVVDDPTVIEPAEAESYFLVEDVLLTLQQLARHHRRQLSIPIIAITGSNGKTTTKELVGAVMNQRYQTPYTQGNYNNHIGVPLTLLTIDAKADAAIIEMGANHQREIDFLCRIAEPTHGLITNIGKAHLEGFGGIEGVKKGKSELYRYLAEKDGVAFVNRDERFLEELAAPVTRKVFYESSNLPNSRYVPYELKCHSVQPNIKVAFLGPSGEWVEVKSELSGPHNFQNIMTAIAVGRYFKVPVEQIAEAIADYRPRNNRSEWREWQGIRVYLDAYNANPSSVEASLTDFAGLEGKPKVVILGDMLELGAESREEHWKLAQLAVSLPLDEVILVGPEYAAAAQQLQLPHYASVDELKASFVPARWSGGYLMVKGSRAIALERLLA